MFDGVWRRLRAIFWKDEFEAELEEELRFHLEQEVERNLRAGMELREARLAALKEFDGMAQSKEECRDARGVRWVEEASQDFRYGLRLLRKSPLFCLTSILTLAIGIGSNTAIFTLVYGLFLKALPVSEPGRLARVSLSIPIPGREVADAGIPWRMYHELRRTQRSFTDLAAFIFGDVTLQDRDGITRAQSALLMTGNAFEILGIKPHLGRGFTSQDDIPGGPREGWPIVLSYSFWKDRFGGDPAVIGKKIEVSKSFATVIGVAPPGFEGVTPGRPARVFAPIQFFTVLTEDNELNSPTSRLFCRPIGRLKPEMDLARANAELSSRQKELIAQYLPPQSIPSAWLENTSLLVSTARNGAFSFFNNDYARPLLLIQGLVAIVLLLCCINVGGLLLSKAATRRHEFSVRASLGAGRSRLVRQYLTESFTLAAAGAVLGALAAWFGNQFLLKFFIHTNAQEGLQVTPDVTVFLCAAACAVITTLLFGSIPAWGAARSDLGGLLRSKTPSRLRRSIGGRAFVPVQVAMSIVLLASAGLLSRSLLRMHGEQVGYDIEHITITCAQFQKLPQKDDALLDVYQQMVDRLNQSPGVESAAVTWFTPMTNDMAVSSFQAVSERGAAIEDKQMAWNVVGPGYFRTMQTRILRGREFTPDERRSDICVLNQSAANYLFPGADPIGHYVRTTDARRFPQPVACRVIGIAEDAKYSSPREQPPRTLYFAIHKDNLYGNLVFLMRSAKEQTAAAAYQKALAEIAPTSPLLRFVTLEKQMDDSMGSQRLITLLVNLFSGLAVFLSAIGLYSLLSSSVVERTYEIGLRIALGAQRSRVLWMILQESMFLLSIGLSFGGLAFLFSVRFIQEMLYGVTRFDPINMIGAGSLIAVAILLAALAPAIRAASIDPIKALRAE
jgi:predicted permease